MKAELLYGQDGAIYLRFALVDHAQDPESVLLREFIRQNTMRPLWLVTDGGYYSNFQDPALNCTWWAIRRRVAMVGKLKWYERLRRAIAR
jgi:hypothetical protein